MRLALYQPDIPQNTGTILRMAACFGLPVDIIEPCGFVITDKGLKRAGMDYLDRAAMVRHASWLAYQQAAQDFGGRLVLMTTQAASPAQDFTFRPNDRLLFGRESAGVPAEVHAAADARLKIPMRAETRSLNVALSAAMITFEALRQTQGFPHGASTTDEGSPA